MPVAVIVFAALLVCFPSPLVAQRSPTDLPDRRVFVPLDDLDVVVERDKQGVLLSRMEFRRLLELAKQNAAVNEAPPVGQLLARCDYAARIAGDQLLITVKADLRHLQPGWQAWSFPLQRLSIEKATLNGEPAFLGRKENGALAVLTSQPGQYELQLELSTEIVTLGSDQVVAFALLGGPAGELTLTLPAGKRLLIGGLQLERPAKIDEPATYAVAIGGHTNVQLRITDRATDRKADALVFATTGYGLFVAPGEVTWHALTTLQVFGRPLDRVVCSVPDVLEIADVESTGLEAWQLSDDPAHPQRTLITLTYGQPFDGARRIMLRGVMPSAAGEPWAVPPLKIHEVTSHVSQAVVQYPAGVRLQVLELDGVRRATLQQKAVSDMPGDMGKASAAESLRFDAWREEFTLRAVTQPKQREVHAAVAVVLDVASAGVTMQAALTLTPRYAPLFDVDVRIPAEWTVASAVGPGNQPMKWELVPHEAGVNHVRFALPQPVAPGVEARVKLEVRREIEGWPAEAAPIVFPLPELVLPQATLTETAFVIRGDADLELVAEEFHGLDPAPLKADWERLRFQSQDTRYDGRLKVTRKPVRLAAQTLGFYRLDPQNLHATVFALVLADGGGARQLEFSLPEAVSDTVRFQLSGVIEQQTLPPENGRRRWRLKLADRLRGGAVVWAEMDLPRKSGETVAAPMVQVEGAERQSGALVIEAGPEQQLTIAANDAQGQPLAETDPVDLPSVTYLPKERIIAAYRTVTTGASLSLSEQKFDKSAVPTAVCPLLQMTSVLAETGELQQRAQFQLTAAGVPQLRVRLPDESKLWAALIDNRPVEVRRQEDVYVLPMPASTSGANDVAVTLFYRQKVDRLDRMGTLRQTPPELTAVSGQGQAEPVELLEQRWELLHPGNTLLVDSRGHLEPTTPLEQPGWLAEWRHWVREPSWEAIGWGAFTIAVTAGVFALFVLMYQRRGSRGVAETLAAMLALGCVGFCLLLSSPQARMASRSKSGATQPLAYFRESDSEASRPFVELQSAPQSSAPMPAPAAPPLPELAKSDEKLAESLKSAKGLAPLARPNPSKPHPQAKDASPVRRWGVSSLDDDEERLARDKSKEKKKQEQAERKDSLSRPANDVDAFAGDQPMAPEPKLDAAARGEREAAGREAAGREAEELAFDDRSGKKGGLGLLSLSLALESPPGSFSTSFRYLGANGAAGEPALELDYVDRRTGRMYRLLLVAVGLFFGWLTRTWPVGRKLAVFSVLVGVAWGLLPVSPMSWQVTLDGVFGLACGAAVAWLAYALGHGCEHCCAWCCRTFGVFAILTMGFSSDTASAQEAKVVAPPPLLKPSVIVPYIADQDPLAAERVLLPFDKFVELYRLAHPEKAISTPAPEPGRLLEALYAAELSVPDQQPGAASVQITARLTLRSFVDGQWTVALPFRGVILSESKLDGKSAAVQVEGAELKLLTPTAGLHVLDAKFAVPANVQGTAGAFALALSPTPAARLSFTLPGEKLTVRVNGSTTAYRRVTQGEKTLVELPVDHGGDLQLSWQPEQNRGGGAAVVHVESVTAVTASDAGVTVSAGFKHRVRQGVVRDIAFALPEGVRLQTVTGPDVGGWEVVGDGVERRLRVFLRRNVGDATELTVDTYLPERIGAAPSAFTVPEIAPVDATAEVGFVALYAGDQFSLQTAGVAGLQQVDTAGYQPAVGVTRLDAAPQMLYRFSKRPWTLPLTATRLVSQMQVALQQGHRISDRKVRTSTRLVCDLSRVPQSSLELRVPASWVVLDVQSNGLRDWFVTPGEDRPVLTLEYDQPRQGAVEIVVLSTQPRDPADAVVPLDTLEVTGAKRVRRQAAVWLETGLAAQVQSLGGWRAIDASTIPATLHNLQAAAPQLAFESLQETPAVFELLVSRAQPRLMADSLTSLTVTDVALVYGFVFQWDIERAATDRIALDTPSDLQGKLDFQGANLRDVATAALPDGRLRWTLSLRTPVMGRFKLTAAATLPPSAGRIASPGITFVTADALPTPLETQRDYVLLVNTSLNQLTNADATLSEPVQREDLAIVVRPELANQATEFVRVKSPGASLAWTVQRFTPTAGIPASVNLADLTTILARDGSYRGSAVYTLKNRSRQFLAIRLPDGARLLSVFVGEQPSRTVITKIGDKPTQLIALPKTSAADLSFPVTVTYAGRLPRPFPRKSELIGDEVDLPSPQIIGQDESADFGVPVARTRWTVYLPDDLDTSPLRDHRRHNLNNHTRDGDADSFKARALLQDYAEILSNFDSLGSSRVRTQAYYNLQQLEQELDQSSLAAGGKDASLQEERRKLQSRFHDLSRTLNETVDGLAVMNDAANPSGGLVQSQDAQLQLGIAIGNNSVLFNDNRPVGHDSRPLGETPSSDFNFRLAAPAPSEAAAKAAASAQQPSRSNRNLDARNYYQAQNEDQLRELNDSFAGKKQQQNPQSDFGLQIPNRTGLQSGSNPGQPQSGSGARGQVRMFGANPWKDGAESDQPLGNAGPVTGNSAIGNWPANGPAGASDPSASFFSKNRFAAPSGAMGGGGGMGGGLGGMPGSVVNGSRTDRNSGQGNGETLQNVDALHDMMVIDGVAGMLNLGGGMGGGGGAGVGSGTGSGWKQTGGLSLAMELPTDGQKLVFAKAAGDAKLALHVRPKQTLSLALGMVWTLTCIAAAIAVVWSTWRPDGSRRGLLLAAAVAAAIGVIVLAFPLNGVAFVAFLAACAGLAIHACRDGAS